MLVGLQLPAILDAVEGQARADLFFDGALIAGTVIAVRMAWVFPFTYIPRLLFRRVRERDPSPPWQHTLLVAWTGMRGAVSLAAALALPLTIDGGGAFPERGTIIFLTFAVILGTLLLQGLTLPLLIRALGVDDRDEALEREEDKARLAAAEGALSRIDELVSEDWVREDTAERVRGVYRYRQRRFGARFDVDGDVDGIEDRSEAYQRLVRELLDAQRDLVDQLRRKASSRAGRPADHSRSRPRGSAARCLVVGA